MFDFDTGPHQVSCAGLKLTFRVQGLQLEISRLRSGGARTESLHHQAWLKLSVTEQQAPSAGGPQLSQRWMKWGRRAMLIRQVISAFPAPPPSAIHPPLEGPQPRHLTVYLSLCPQCWCTSPSVEKWEQDVGLGLKTWHLSLFRRVACS